MTADEFRTAALRQPDAVEFAHGGHPDFRIRNKVFAGLTGDGSAGSLKLTPEQQDMLMAARPGAFHPAAGSWGARGWTLVALAGLDEADIVPPLSMAWANAAPARLRRAHVSEGGTE